MAEEQGPRRRSWVWVWYFAVLAVLGAVALVVPLVYNLGLQLKPEQLDAARARWREKGPSDYDLEYREKIDPNERIFTYQVKVRGGRVVAFQCNGRDEGTNDPEVQEHSVDGLFREIEARLREDEAKGGRRNYVTAAFDRTDGHPVRYVRRVAGTHERVEWNVKLTAPPP
jgi:hypothetical protein